jgi:hypothetical protein
LLAFNVCFHESIKIYHFNVDKLFSAGEDLWKVPNTSTSLEITYGNLELAKVRSIQRKQTINSILMDDVFCVMLKKVKAWYFSIDF